jgi:hypothetical protein
MRNRLYCYEHAAVFSKTPYTIQYLHAKSNKMRFDLVGVGMCTSFVHLLVQICGSSCGMAGQRHIKGPDVL